ncbi:hypothetical protein TA3x_003174 [Tundrisphaera sp. TA3]|uniref:hypothetical protein n=1 Tax=Tundrisphaera sp. TA3 TaxID=3435775 RepID=UPI003EBBBF5D
MEVLLALIVGVALIAVVGHGIWVLAFAVNRRLLMLGRRPIEPARQAAMCPRCGNTWNPQAGPMPCLLCGWNPDPSERPAPPRPDLLLAQLGRRIELYAKLGLVSPGLKDRLLAEIRAEAPAPIATPAAPPIAEPVAAAPVVRWAPEPEAPAATPADLPERARAYRDALAARTADEAPPPPPPAPAAGRPHRIFEVLSAFLEEKSIRWGELVGGLLIVGCSMALVLSFWSSIAERPWIKYGLFNGVTALLFALGGHAERRWKLPTTAAGLLIIATLLTPLNFLAVASLVRGGRVEPAWGLAGEVAAIAAFAVLVWRAGRWLVGLAPWTLVAGVIVPSASMLLLRRAVDAGGSLNLALGLGAIPWLAQAAALGGWSARSRGGPEFGERRAAEMLRLLGLGTFAAAVAFGLVLAHAGPAPQIPGRMAPLAPLIGATILAPGLLLWRRAAARELVGYRTAGTAIAAAGTLILLSGVALAWPSPARIMPVALLDFAVLTAIAFAFRVPAAHVLAGACLSLAYLVGWAIASGRMGWSGITSAEAARVLLSAGGGTALMPFVLTFGVVAAAGTRAGRRHDAQAFGLVAALAALASLALVTWHGFGRAGDPEGATWVYLGHALIAGASALWLARTPALARGLAGAGSALLLASLMQGLTFGGFPIRPHLPVIVALLGHAALAVLAGLLLTPGGRRAPGVEGEEPAPIRPAGRIFGPILDGSALLSSVAAAAVLILVGEHSFRRVVAADAAWLSAVWVALAFRFASPALFGMGQAALAGAVVFAVPALVETFPWLGQARPRRADPGMILKQAVALGLYCLAWIGARVALRRRPKLMPTLGPLIDPAWPAVDRWIRFAVVALAVMVALDAAAPGVARELGRWAGPISGDVASVHAFRIPGIPHFLRIGIIHWAVWGSAIAVMLAGMWERFRRLDLLVALAVAMMAAPLAAGRWESSQAAASALGWGGAIALFLASLLIWGRGRLARWADRLGWRAGPDQVVDLRGQATGMAIGLGTFPIALQVWTILGVILAGGTPVGPPPGTIFGRLGLIGSVVPPLLLLAATLVGFAIRERSSGSAFAAGLVANLAASLGFVLARLSGGMAFDGRFWTYLHQINAIVSAATALAWMGGLAAARRRRGGAGPISSDALMTTTVAIAAAFAVAPIVGGTLALWQDPAASPTNLVVAGPLGFIALGLAAGSVSLRSRLLARPIDPDWAGLGAVALAAFLAMGLAFRDPGNWFTYHGLMVGQAMAGVLLPLVAWRNAGLQAGRVARGVRLAVTRWSTLVLMVVVAFAIRGYWSDPQSPWWTVGGLALMGGLAAILAGWSGWPGYLKPAALLLNLAATFWWCARSSWTAWAAPIDLALVNIIALAVPAPLWLRIERRIGARSAPFQQVVAWLALVAMAMVVVASLGEGAWFAPNDSITLLGWLALAATALAMGSGLRDERARAPVAGLYLLGLVASGWVVAQFHLPARWLAWTGTMVLAAYSVGTSYLWSRRAGLRALADRLGFPRPALDDPGANLLWLIPANLALAAGVIGLAFGTILDDREVALRTASANSALAQALAIGLLARGARRTQLQAMALAVGVLGAIALGWAGIAPGSASAMLDRAAVVLAATAGGAALYGLGLAKFTRRDDDWTRAARRLVPSLLGLALAALVLILGVEIGERLQGRPILIAAPAIATIALSLVGAAAAALVAAVVPGRDPLGLSERGRTAYVYGAELLLAALGAHLKLSLPWIFTGRFVQYWPLMLMALAFAGVGLAEVFRRQGRMVLSVPLERTGAFLPLLPLLASFWMPPRPGDGVVYLALVGCLYAVLGTMRSSLLFGSLATLAGNGALWTWLAHQERLSLADHPQLWVIPPALCVLIGAYLNRDRLSRSQMAGIRYASAMAIYLASTADIVLTGVGRAPWLPGVLAGLSIAGIFAGIWLRVRGFLFLGLGFLSLALFSIIWYAAVDLRQTWLWAASGVVAGVVILAVFALFEKKRLEILRVVGQIKEWSP